MRDYLQRMFSRPRLELVFHCDTARVSESQHSLELRGRLVLRNLGAAATVTLDQIFLHAASRRIELPQPQVAREARTIGARSEMELHVEWSLTLAAPLRASAGELVVTFLDHRRRRLQYTCPLELATTG